MKTKPRVLLVDDEPGIRRVLREILEFEGYGISEAKDGEEALKMLSSSGTDLLLLDVKMDGIDGLELLKILRDRQFDFPVIMLTGHGNIDTAIQATRLGAFDFLEKPPDLNRLLISVRNALEINSLAKENLRMRRKISNVSEILGSSTAIASIRETIAKVAPTEARVLITGENGTGKELVARWIHELSRRASGPFVEVNCAAIPSELLESELFGHEKGAFTGAIRQRIGKFEQADGGTLFLDEIGDMEYASQAKVLRVLQENRLIRVGGSEAVEVDVRIIAATNKDLKSEIEVGKFREDLYHRLNVIPIHVPSLRDRIEDIAELAKSFLERLARKDIVFSDKSFSPDALDTLTFKSWTGNVRELQNAVERLAILTRDSVIGADDVEFLVQSGSLSAENKRISADQFSAMIERSGDFHEFRDLAEKSYLEYMLDKHDWNISQTADRIGIQRSHMYNKMKKYSLER
jgi:two-component system, NtrC family, nitrogen regulation response regulator NtrX